MFWKQHSLIFFLSCIHFSEKHLNFSCIYFFSVSWILECINIFSFAAFTFIVLCVSMHIIKEGRAGVSNVFISNYCRRVRVCVKEILFHFAILFIAVVLFILHKRTISVIRINYIFGHIKKKNPSRLTKLLSKYSSVEK